MRGNEYVKPGYRFAGLMLLVSLPPVEAQDSCNRLVSLREAFWNDAAETAYRWDIANPRLGDVATEVVIRNSDSSYTMAVVRLKVQENRITEVEVIRANEGDAGALWGLQTTGQFPDGTFRSAPDGFDTGRFIGRNLWDRRYPVVDEERGIVLSIVRFGIKEGMESQSAVTSNDRLVGEFFQVKNGMIQEVHAVLYNLPDEIPSVWEPEYGPARSGW
jgi:hypothetical protein